MTQTQARVLVLAFDVGGAFGIGDAWRQGGLSNSSAVLCGPPENFSFPAPCSTIWLQMADCSIFALADVQLNTTASLFTTTMASLLLTARVKALAEGSYPFQLHLPVSDGLEWSYRRMNGTFSISAVADARLSNLTLCQGAECNVTATNVFESTNGALGPVVVWVSAVNVHG